MFEDRIYLTVDESAKYIGCSPKTIRRRVADGTIPAYTLGSPRQSRRLIRIEKSALDKAMKQVSAYKVGGVLA